ncbi:nicotinamide riboside kinase 1 isoform X1 [Procambarus clarkii]|uniref:nicotinamide riboside kinase 1 isoform X1 n=2 Tax=Procambarus clarkii TaxID=6728 RepID=UPI0037441458
MQKPTFKFKFKYGFQRNMALLNLYTLHEELQAKTSSSGWRVVGLSGATGGGKTTLANQLLASLPTTTLYLTQDEYILPDHSNAHLKAPEPLKGYNKDSLASIDMTKMIADIKQILATDGRDINFVDYDEIHNRSKIIGSALNIPRPPFIGHKEKSHLSSVLLLDGFLLFNHPEVPQFCDLLYFITLTKEQCLERRKMRVFTNVSMNSEQYFELCAWPQYEQHFTQMCNTVNNIHFINGASQPHITYERVFKDIMHMLGGDTC